MTAIKTATWQVIDLGAMANKLGSLKFNSCLCQGLREPGKHDENCPTDAIHAGAAALFQLAEENRQLSEGVI